MADTKICHSCRKEIHKNAQKCPYCHALSMEMMKGNLVGVIAFIIFVYFGVFEFTGYWLNWIVAMLASMVIATVVGSILCNRK